MKRIFGLGLPRMAGQTLQHALTYFVPGQYIVHSPHRDWSRLQPDNPRFAGAVEVFAPIQWLERTYPDSLYILNWREKEPWLESCYRHWQRSYEQNWHHPMWRYHWSQWGDYYDDWKHKFFRDEYFSDDSILYLDITWTPSWEPLEKFLGKELPHPKPAFPRSDMHAN